LPVKVLTYVKAEFNNFLLSHFFMAGTGKSERGNFKLITGRRFPRALGSDIAGIVRETGKNVAEFQAGDAVMAAEKD
jgi:NADPH:quinone reductase-like Zn-dependent oxidoreductase